MSDNVNYTVPVQPIDPPVPIAGSTETETRQRKPRQKRAAGKLVIEPRKPKLPRDPSLAYYVAESDGNGGIASLLYKRPTIGQARRALEMVAEVRNMTASDLVIVRVKIVS